VVSGLKIADIMKCTGVVLSGGKSERMGKDKGLMVFGEEPLVKRNLRFLEGLCDEVLISANDAAYEAFGYTVIQDRYKGIGPIAGIYEALRQAKHEWVLMLSCDLVFPEGDLLAALIDAMKEGFDLVAYKKGERAEPLFACYSKALLPMVEARIERGEYKLQHLIRETKAGFLNIPLIGDAAGKEQEAEIINVNTREDYARALHIFAPKEK
jgi:molybdopterin-guanine dinucleotide biosynthesis protein A